MDTRSALLSAAICALAIFLALIHNPSLLYLTGWWYMAGTLEAPTLQPPQAFFFSAIIGVIIYLSFILAARFKGAIEGLILFIGFTSCILFSFAFLYFIVHYQDSPSRFESEYGRERSVR